MGMLRHALDKNSKGTWLEKLGSIFDQSAEYLNTLNAMYDHITFAEKTTKIHIQPKIVATIIEPNGKANLDCSALDKLDNLVSGQFKSYFGDINRLKIAVYDRYFGIDYGTILEALGRLQKISPENEVLLKNAIGVFLDKTATNVENLKKTAQNLDFSFYNDNQIIASMKKNFDNEFKKLKNEFIEKTPEIDKLWLSALNELKKYKSTVITDVRTLDSETLRIQRDFKQILNRIFDDKLATEPLSDHFMPRTEFLRLKRQYQMKYPEDGHILQTISNIMTTIDRIATMANTWERFVDGKEENEMDETVDRLALQPFKRIIFKDDVKGDISFPSLKLFTDVDERRKKLIALVGSVKYHLYEITTGADMVNLTKKMKGLVKNRARLQINADTDNALLNIAQRFKNILKDYKDIIRPEFNSFVGDKLNELHNKMFFECKLLRQKFDDLNEASKNPLISKYVVLTQSLFDHKKSIDGIDTAQFTFMEALDNAFGTNLRKEIKHKSKRRITIADTPRLFRYNNFKEFFDTQLSKYLSDDPIYETLKRINNIIISDNVVADNVNMVIDAILKFRPLKVDVLAKEFYPDTRSFDFVDSRRAHLTLLLGKMSDQIHEYLCDLEIIAKRNHLISDSQKIVHPQSKIINDIDMDQMKINRVIDRMNIKRIVQLYTSIRKQALDISKTPKDKILVENARKELPDKVNRIAGAYCYLLAFDDVYTKFLNNVMKKIAPVMDDINRNIQKNGEEIDENGESSKLPRDVPLEGAPSARELLQDYEPSAVLPIRKR